MSLPNKLFVMPHLGCGDAIVLNGLVRYWAPKCDELIWPCKLQNASSVGYMFSDLKNVVVQQVACDEDALHLAHTYGHRQAIILWLGLHSKVPCDFGYWGEQMYHQAGVSFSQRWDGFNLPGGVRTPDAKEEKGVAFLHDDAERGFVIDRSKVRMRELVTPRRIEQGTIFDWLADLQTASEIHVIDSAFLCLTDSVPTLAERLVFHKYARPGGHPPTLRKKWEILE